MSTTRATTTKAPTTTKPSTTIATAVVTNGVVTGWTPQTVLPAKMISLTIPNTAETINPAVFRGCVALPSVVIPPSVKNVGSQAFAGCTKLAGVKFENALELETVGLDVFTGTPYLPTWTANLPILIKNGVTPAA